MAPSCERWVASKLGGWTSWFFSSRGRRFFRSFSGYITKKGTVHFSRPAPLFDGIQGAEKARQSKAQRGERDGIILPATFAETGGTPPEFLSGRRPRTTQVPQ